MKDLELATRYLRTSQAAKARGLVFELTFLQFKNILSRKYCPYSGVLMDDESNGDNQRTLDRIDASIGYVSGNVIACSKRINSMKGNLTSREILRMAEVIRGIVRKRGGITSERVKDIVKGQNVTCCDGLSSVAIFNMEKVIEKLGPLFPKVEKPVFLWPNVDDEDRDKNFVG